MSTSKNTFVMFDEEYYNHFVTKFNALDEHVRKLLAEKEKREKYISSEEGVERYVTPKQLAQKLNKSISTIYSWMSKGIIKRKKIGRSTYLDFEEVLQVLKS